MSTLREALEKILHDQPHADTCGAVISDHEVYPCGCWQKLVREALAEASQRSETGTRHLTEHQKAVEEAAGMNLDWGMAAAYEAGQAGSDTPAPRGAIAEGDEVWVRCKVAHLQSEPLNQQEHIEVGYPSGQGFAFFAKREDIRAADQTPRASSEGRE